MNHVVALRDEVDYFYVGVKDVTDGHITWLNDFAGRGHYSLGGHGIYFELESDAVWFSLRWAEE